MLYRLGFILQQYAELLIFTGAAWGYGRLAIRRSLRQQVFVHPVLGHALTATVGLGIVICLLLAVAIAGHLRAGWVYLLIACGFIAAVVGTAIDVRDQKATPVPSMPPRRWTVSGAAGFAVPTLLFLMTVLRPPAPPTACDELMYHLPHAQQWALAGTLTVNDWLRYAWFPFDYELLYASALLTAGDVMPHFLHALAGWLVMLLVYGVGLIRLGRPTALLAASIWLALVWGDFNTAYIDMGLALFVFASCIAFLFWVELPGKPSLLVLAAFLLGVAVGTKYQALTLVPFFFAAMLWRERRPRTFIVLLAAAVFLVPCVYWYGRNALLTGDPFQPFGGKIFGFTDWNLDDFSAQFADLKRARALPSWLLWPALAVCVVPAWRQDAVVRRASVFGLYALVVWAATSGYPRYLMSAYPALSLLSAHGWLAIGQSARARLLPRSVGANWRPPDQALLALVAVLAIAAAFPIYRSWKRVAATPQERAEIVRSSISGYGAMEFLARQPYRKTYQFFTEYGIYYLPQPVWGEVFGRWRYRDFALQPRDLYPKLVAFGFQQLVVNVQAAPEFVASADFERYFAPIYSDADVRVYLVRETPLPAVPAP